MPENNNKTSMLACIIGRDPETGLFLGHCLNYDLMESGSTPDEAWQKLKAVVKAHIEHCYTHYRKGLEVTASRQEWARFAELLKENKDSLTVEKIEIQLTAPLADEVPIWMQRVSNVESACAVV